MSTYDDVMAAWRLIENPAHWCKGKARDGDRMCAEGAVFVATEAGYFRGAAVLRALAMALPGGGRKVWLYNDAPGTMHADIRALFERAAASVRPTRRRPRGRGAKTAARKK